MHEVTLINGKLGRQLSETFVLYWLGVTVIFLLVPLLSLIMTMGYGETFDFRLIILDIFLFSIILKASPTEQIRKMALQAFFIRHLFLFLLILVNISLGQDLFLLVDDITYHELAKDASLFSPFFRDRVFVGTSLLEGAYYFRFLEFFYRMAGPSTLTGRLINIFLSVMIGIISFKITERYSGNLNNERMTKFILFFPDLLLFSIFEFKDLLFSFLCLLIILCCQNAIIARQKRWFFRMFFSLALGLSIAFFSTWLRSGIGLFFLTFSLFTFVLPLKFLYSEITISPKRFSAFILFIFFIFLGILKLPVETGNITLNLIFLKIQKYLIYTGEALEASSGILKNLAMTKPWDIFKIPLAITLVPFTPLNLFNSDSFNSSFLGVMRFFSFSIYSGIIISFFLRKVRFTCYEALQIGMPTLVLLVVLSITNIGIFRHFIFLIPFILISSRKYGISFSPRFFMPLGVFVYSAYFTTLLVRI